MNRKKEQLFSNADLPEITQMTNHKKRLREALLLAHKERSGFLMFGSLTKNTLQTMSTVQKSLAVGALALAIIVGAAGVFGPSAYSVANAQAQETIDRAFVRLANLSDEERATLEERFQEGIHVKAGDHDGKFLALHELTPEEIEARHEEMRVSLTETLAEAQAAPDLQIISADELPVSGFFGQAGRVFGFKMTKHHEDMEEKLANLPEDIRENFVMETTDDGKTIYRHNGEGQHEGTFMHAQMNEERVPTSFMVYTNADGDTIYLGLNINDEPVVKFVQSEDGEIMSASHGGRMLLKTESDTE